MGTEARDATKVTHRSGTPRDLVRLWVDTFNRAGADALAAFYADDAVHHQVAKSPGVRCALSACLAFGS